MMGFGVGYREPAVQPSEAWGPSPVGSAMHSDRLRGEMGFLTLAISSSILLGAWKFGLGIYRGRLTVWAVLLVSGGAALATYAVRGTATGNLEIDGDVFRAGIVAGALNLAGTYLLLQAYERGKVAVAGGVSSAESLVPVLFALLTGVAVTISTALGVVMVLAGLAGFYVARAITPADQALAGGKGGNTSVLLALGAAMCWGMGLLVVAVGSRTSITGTEFVQQGTQVLVVAAVVFASPRRQLAGLSWRSGAVLAGSGLALGLGNVALFAAAAAGSLALAAVLAAMSPLVTAVLAFWFLKEKLARIEVLALLIVVTGVGLIAA